MRHLLKKLKGAIEALTAQIEQTAADSRTPGADETERLKVRRTALEEHLADVEKRHAENN